VNNTADSNTAIGVRALFSNTTGTGNTANGVDALLGNNTGHDNTANGVDSLSANANGAFNTANGVEALWSNQSGSSNTADGVNALHLNTTGNNNTALGNSAGSNLTTRDNNIDIGYNVLGAAGEDNTIRIGNTDITTTIIRGIFGQIVPSGMTVLVDSDGLLGTLPSSRRFKEGIKPMDQASEALFALKPVSFCYNKKLDPAGTAQFGLIAEDGKSKP